MIWPIPVDDWPILVDDLANTGRHFANTGTFSRFSRFEVEIEDSKNMEGHTIIPRYEIKNKKIDLATEVYF